MRCGTCCWASWTRRHLTLGDNRRVDFSRAMIFMTSNLGAAEMSSILRPNLGFAACEADAPACRRHRRRCAARTRSSRAGVEAARRKFTPEFMNRIDKTVVFRPLGENELRKILTLELNIVQQRIFSSRQRRALCVLADRCRQGIPAAGGHRPEVRRPAPEARDRSQPGSSAVEPDRDRTGARRRPDPRRFRRGCGPALVLQRSRGHARLRHGADGGHVDRRRRSEFTRPARRRIQPRAANARSTRR